MINHDKSWIFFISSSACLIMHSTSGCVIDIVEEDITDDVRLRLHSG